MGRIPSIKMQVSTTLILIHQEIIVVCILNYALNLGRFFLRELGHSYCLKLSMVE